MDSLQVLPNTAKGVLELMPASRTQVDVFSDQLIESVQNGELDPLQLRATFKALEMVMERVNKETQAEQLTEAEKYPGDKFEAFGCTMQKADVYTAYDFGKCNDPAWNGLSSILEQTKQQMKDREAFLKTVKAPMMIADEGTGGEQVTILPPSKKTTAGLKISIK